MDKREERDAMLKAIEWRVARHETQGKIGITPADDDETYIKILEYMQYLRDIPQNPSFPDVEIKTFEEWSK